MKRLLEAKERQRKQVHSRHVAQNPQFYKIIGSILIFFNQSITIIKL